MTRCFRLHHAHDSCDYFVDGDALPYGGAPPYCFADVAYDAVGAVSVRLHIPQNLAQFLKIGIWPLHKSERCAGVYNDSREWLVNFMRDRRGHFGKQPNALQPAYFFAPTP